MRRILTFVLLGALLTIGLVPGASPVKTELQELLVPLIQDALEELEQKTNIVADHIGIDPLSWSATLTTRFGTFLFSVEGEATVEPIVEALNEGRISEELRAAFQDNGFDLSEEASVRQLDTSEWLIASVRRDGREEEFRIRKEDDALIIYSSTSNRWISLNNPPDPHTLPSEPTEARALFRELFPALAESLEMLGGEIWFVGSFLSAEELEAEQLVLLEGFAELFNRAYPNEVVLIGETMRVQDSIAKYGELVSRTVRRIAVVDALPRDPEELQRLFPGTVQRQFDGDLEAAWAYWEAEVLRPLEEALAEGSELFDHRPVRDATDFSNLEPLEEEEVLYVFLAHVVRIDGIPHVILPSGDEVNASQLDEKAAQVPLLGLIVCRPEEVPENYVAFMEALVKSGAHLIPTAGQGVRLPAQITTKIIESLSPLQQLLEAQETFTVADLLRYFPRQIELEGVGEEYYTLRLYALVEQGQVVFLWSSSPSEGADDEAQDRGSSTD